MMNLQLEIIFHLHENWFHGGRFGREWEFGAFFCAGGSSVAENLRALAKVGIVPPKSQCLKIAQKVAFNIASEASYVYILSGQKLT